MKVGATVKFIKYAEKNEDPLLDNGTLVRIKSIEDTDDGKAYTVSPLDDDEIEETLYSDEIMAVKDKAVKIVKEAPAPVAAKKAAKKAAPVEDEDEVEEEEAAPVAKKSATKKAAVKEAPVKKVATKKAAVVKEPEPALVLTAAVKKSIKGTNAVAAAKTLLHKSVAQDITLGGVLAKILADKDYETVTEEDGTELKFEGKSGFEDFCEKYLQTAYRKAMYLIKNYKAVTALGLDEDRAATIGYSKLKEITDVMLADPANAETYLEQAETLSIDKLKAEVIKTRKKLKLDVKPRGTTGTTNVNHVKMTFSFFADQAETVTEAIERAKEACGEPNATENDALLYIINEWTQLAE